MYKFTLLLRGFLVFFCMSFLVDCELLRDRVLSILFAAVSLPFSQWLYSVNVSE